MIDQQTQIERVLVDLLAEKLVEIKLVA